MISLWPLSRVETGEGVGPNSWFPRLYPFHWSSEDGSGKVTGVKEGVGRTCCTGTNCNVARGWDEMFSVWLDKGKLERACSWPWGSPVDWWKELNTGLGVEGCKRESCAMTKKRRKSFFSSKYHRLEFLLYLEFWVLQRRVRYPLHSRELSLAIAFLLNCPV